MNQPTRNPWRSVLVLNGTGARVPLAALGALHDDGEGMEWNEDHVRSVLAKKSPEEIARAMANRWKDPVFPRLDWMLDVLLLQAQQAALGAPSAFHDNLPYKQFATWLIWLGRQLEPYVHEPWKEPLAGLLADTQGWLERGPLPDLPRYREHFYGKVCRTMALSVLVGMVVEGLTAPHTLLSQPFFHVKRLCDRMEQAYLASNFISTWDGAEVLQGIVRAFPIPNPDLVRALLSLEDHLRNEGKLP